MRTPLFLVLATTTMSCGLQSLDAPSAFECDSAVAPSPTPMRRLSHDQYVQTVRAAVELLGGDALIDGVWRDVDRLVARIPEDVADETLSRQDQAVSQMHAEQWYLVAEAVADGVLRQEPLPCEDAACVTDWVRSRGSRLLRRPLNDDEITFFVDEVYARAPDHAQGVRDLVLVWLSHPHFVMQVEHGVDGDGETMPLTAFELASRLSFHAWNTPPDDELWAAAADASLLDDDVYADQVARLFDDPRSQGPRERFFRDWLQLDDVPRLDLQVGQPRFDAFRGDLEPSEELRELVQDDVLTLLEWHVRHGSSYDAVLLDAPNTVLDPEVGALYGVTDLWDGVSLPGPLTTGHGGLLTRPAFHVTGTSSTRPIKKGVLVRRRILCDGLGDPPADLGPEPEIDPAASQRVRTEQLTEIEGSLCASCHSYINPLGYATERFDGLGRVRTEETVYGADGEVLGVHPVDDEAPLRVEWSDETLTAGPEALAEVLAESAKTDACLARFWFRHTWGRAEDDAVDGCALQNVEMRLREGASLDDALRQSALDPSFRLRRFDEGDQP